MSNSIPIPPAGTPMPAPSVEASIMRSLTNDRKRGWPVLSSDIWNTVVSRDGDVSAWGKPFYYHLLTVFGMMRQSPGDNLHGPIEDPCGTRKASTYYKPENVKVIRIGGVFICAGIESGIYVAQIRDNFYDSYRLISPAVDSYDSAFDMAVNNEGSPMASRDGQALFSN